MKIPKTIEGCIDLLKNLFPENPIYIEKTVMYFPGPFAHTDTAYAVYISKQIKNFNLRDIEAVRNFIELTILDKGEKQ